MTTALPLKALTEDICVAPQLLPEQLQEAADAGFRSVVNNRPDHEGGPDQPTSAAIEAAARAAGLEYVHLPVHPAMQTPDQIARMAELLKTLPRPLLMFCRTGTRSTKLYAQALQAKP